MKIEVLYGGDGGVVVRGVDTDGEDVQFAGDTLAPGEELTIHLRDVHEQSRVEFGEKKPIEDAEAEQPAGS